MVLLRFGSSRIIFLVLAGSFITCFSSTDAASTKAPKSNVCHTEACRTIGASILQKMDQSVNPCENFYDFVCGNFTKNAELPSSWSQTDLIGQLIDKVTVQLNYSIVNQITDKDPEAFHKLRTYYNTCIDEDQIEKSGNDELVEILSNLGGWPVLLGNAFNEAAFDWKNTVKNIDELGYTAKGIINLEIATDFNNNSRKMIFIDQPAFNVPHAYLSRGADNDIVKAYLKLFIDVAEIFKVDRKQASLELTESLNFEIELAKISLSATERRDLATLYNPTKVSELSSKYPKIPWLKSFLNSLLNPYVDLTDDDVVIVMVPSYLEALGDLLDRTPKRVLANYLMSQVVYESAEMVGKKVVDAARELIAALTGSSSGPRWQSCVEFLQKNFHVATSSLYVRRHFNKASKDGVSDMIKYLQQSFKKILLEVDWMDEATRSAALFKLEKMIPVVGYFDEILDDEIMNNYYDGLEVHPKSYLKTFLSCKRFLNVKLLKSFREPVVKIDWTDIYSASAVVNAFYNPSSNALQFPAGILQGDFYTEGNPKYVNYASIGSVIGHEMTHGFDDQGSAFDASGNMVDWWNADTKKEYLRRTRCIADQYSNFTDKQVNLTLNGELSLGENIADNGGLKEAYLAYEAFEKERGEEPILPGFEGFSTRQLFWISFGNIWCTKYHDDHLKNVITIDTHAPNHFRIKAVLNSPQFARDFNCPIGSPMNPVHKCSVW